MTEESVFQVCSAGLDTAEDLAQIVECIANRQAEVGLENLKSCPVWCRPFGRRTRMCHVLPRSVA